jgi:Sec-independent protein translocase protein TatA
MRAPDTLSAAGIRSVRGYLPEAISGAASAVTELKAMSPDSTTVRLSDEGRGRYETDQNGPEVKKEGSGAPLHQAAQPGAEEASGSDAIGETLKKLQDLLKEALERLRVAQEQMGQAMAEMKNAGDEAEKMAAMLKVQAAQAQVISAQGEVLQIYTEISKLLEEQQK